jgi:hypothetical protein
MNDLRFHFYDARFRSFPTCFPALPGKEAPLFPVCFLAVSRTAFVSSFLPMGAKRETKRLCPPVGQDHARIVFDCRTDYREGRGNRYAEIAGLPFAKGIALVMRPVGTHDRAFFFLSGQRVAAPHPYGPLLAHSTHRHCCCQTMSYKKFPRV